MLTIVNDPNKNPTTATMVRYVYNNTIMAEMVWRPNQLLAECRVINIRDEDHNAKDEDHNEEERR